MSTLAVRDQDAIRWNDDARTGRPEWTSSPVVQRYRNQLVTGNPDCDWATWIEWKHLPSFVGRALVVGCGTDGRDARVRAGGERQATARIEHRVLEPGRQDWGGPYEAVLASHVLRHVTDLEGVFAGIHDALVPGGKLVFHEYVGRNRFQYTDDQMDLVNRYFRLLPDDLRRDPGTNRTLWRRDRVAPEQRTRDDPTPPEAVRSEDVLAVARSVFQTEREYPGGGGLLSPLLTGIIRNFQEDVPKHQRLLHALCEAEARLSKACAVKSDFVTYVGVRSES